jgi:hypothetical protein
MIYEKSSVFGIVNKNFEETVCLKAYVVFQDISLGLRV